MPKKRTVPKGDTEEQTSVVEEMKVPTLAGTALVLRDPGFSAVDVQPEQVRNKLAAIRTFQDIVRKELIEGQDYGTIPGTPKPTLLKPGAEKIIKLLNLADILTVEDKIEEWKDGFFYYRMKCELVSLITGQTVATGIGSCNSKEDKYAYRWTPEFYLTPTQKESITPASVFKTRRGQQGEFKIYRFPNEEIYTQVNTLLKMASKRAKVDAALSVGRLSNVFTQDIEDAGEDNTSFFSQSPKTRQEGEAKRKPGPKPKEKAPEKSAESENQDVPDEQGLPAAIEKKAEKNSKDSFPMISLKLSNGSHVNVTQFTALDYYKAIKESLNKTTGDDVMYYATLGQFGYEHSKEIPIDRMAAIWDTMISVWKMYANRKDKK